MVGALWESTIVIVAGFVKVWHGVGIGVGAGVGVGVALEAPHTPALVIVSTRHPVTCEELPLSVARRKRSLIVCPFTFGPRFTTVVM